MYLANKSAKRHQNPKDEEINIDWGWGVVCSENCMEEAGTGIRGKNPYILSAGDPASRGQHLEVKDLGAEEEQRLQRKTGPGPLLHSEHAPAAATPLLPSLLWACAAQMEDLGAMPVELGNCLPRRLMHAICGCSFLFLFGYAWSLLPHRLSSACGEPGPLFTAVHRLLLAVTPLVAERGSGSLGSAVGARGLGERRVSSCDALA